MPENELPNPPWRVLAYFDDGTHNHGPFWWTKHRGELWRCCDLEWQHLCVKKERMRVIPHPLNDPGAVAIIERAKEK